MILFDFRSISFFSIFLFSGVLTGQSVQWDRDSSLQAGLPQGMEIYYNHQPLEGAPFRGYFAKIDLLDKKLDFDVDTTQGRRLTPSQFYDRLDSPLLVINGTFFSFVTNQNLNTVIGHGKQLAFGPTTIKGSGRDSLYYYHPLRSALGISRHRKADVAWLFADSTRRKPYAFQQAHLVIKNELSTISIQEHLADITKAHQGDFNKKWRVKTAIGGGPVLIQDGEIHITNREERMFVESADVKHPRTAMGYTSDHHLIILSIEGRHPGIADGVSLMQEAQILKDLGCVEALNLDGGGSSCMLIHGVETITPSDATGQRPVPAVFYVRNKK